MIPRLAPSRSVPWQRKVIDDCFAVDIVGDGRIVQATEIFETERFGHLGPDAQPPFRPRFVH